MLDSGKPRFLLTDCRPEHLMSAINKDARSAATEARIESAFPNRYVFIDVWRGLAIIGVIVYHFVWDLTFFGFIPASILSSAPVTVFARALAGSFMFLAGVSLVLAHNRLTHWRNFFRRLTKLAAAAATISLVTYFLFREGFIYFGVLHSIALASVFGLLFLRISIGFVFLASLAIFAAPLLLETSTFNTRFLAWIGFAADPPLSNDFVPLFPWFGVTLAGIGCTRLFVSRKTMQDAEPHPAGGAVVKGLTWVGQRTLLIYLLHQPLLFASFIAFSRLAAA